VAGGGAASSDAGWAASGAAFSHPATIIAMNTIAVSRFMIISSAVLGGQTPRPAKRFAVAAMVMNA
jgi:hypothetical protein